MKRTRLTLLGLMLGVGLFSAQEEAKPKKGEHKEEKHHHKEIKEVEIVGRKESDYKNSKTFSGTKTATDIKEVPQSISYVTKELIADQGAYTINDVVKNVSGVSQYSFYNDFTIRGFRIQGNRNSGNLVNGMRAATSFWSQQLISNIERVEVIKGPASALFGNASPGGTINRVTKKPLAEKRRSITANIGSFNTIGLQGDFTGPLDKSKTLLYRLNLGYQDTDGFRILQHQKNIIVAPSFSYLASEKTRINVDLVYQNSDGKLDRGQSVKGGDLYSTSIKEALSSANDYLKEISTNVTVSLNHRFSDRLSFNSVFLRSTYDEDLLEHRRANDYVKLADGSYDYNKVIMQSYIRKRKFRNNSFSNFFNYQYDLGQTQNTLLVGYDYFQTDLMPGASQLQANAYLKKDGTAVNNFNPRNISQYVLDANGNPAANVPFFDLTDPSSNGLKDMSKYVYTNRIYSPYRQFSHGFYVQNQMKWGGLSLLLGLRQETFVDKLNIDTAQEKKTSQSVFLPRVGAVYILNPNINVYATWMQGYQPQSASVVSNPDAGGPFDPERSTLYEIGTKTEWLNKRLSASLALFYLTQKGTLYSANDKNNTALMEQIGREMSRGLEVDVMGQILPHWSISANYSYNEAKIKESKNLEEINQQKPNTPKHAGGFWTKYMIPHGSFKNIGIGVGYNFVTEKNGRVGKSYPIVLPSYGVVDAAVYYKMERLLLQMNFNNIFDKTYWVGGYDALGIFPGMPFNVKASVTYKF